MVPDNKIPRTRSIKPIIELLTSRLKFPGSRKIVKLFSKPNDKDASWIRMLEITNKASS
jgi:hypothetical protein